MRGRNLVGFLCLLGSVVGARVLAQGSATTQAGVVRSGDIAGDWQGVAHGAHGDLRLVFRISKTANGWRALAYSIDQPGDPTSVPVVMLQGDAVSFLASYLSGSYAGKLSADGSSIVGTWTLAGGPQRPGTDAIGTQPLVLTRANKQTAWTLPPYAYPAVMAATLDPSFEVTTVKPHDPGVPGGGYRWMAARKFSATVPVSWLIEYVYGIQKKQLINAPEWADKDVYDFAGVPDMPGLPTEQQRIGMMRKLLEERFGLKVHTEKRELPAFVLSVTKGGAKMTPSAIVDPGASLFMRPGIAGGLLLPARNTAMGDFIRLLQQALERPVVDQTGLKGQFDFDLTFMPDESVFGGNIHLPPTDAPPPGLFTAMQEQLGLKLAPAKEPVDVIVVDHLERPSAN